MANKPDWKLKEMDTESAVEEIAIRSKLLQPCECECGEFIYYDSFGQNEDKAYKLANYLFSKEFPIVKHFATRQALTDAIKEAVPNFNTKCHSESYYEYQMEKERDK